MVALDQRVGRDLDAELGVHFLGDVFESHAGLSEADEHLLLLLARAALTIPAMLHTRGRRNEGGSWDGGSLGCVGEEPPLAAEAASAVSTSPACAYGSMEPRRLAAGG